MKIFTFYMKPGDTPLEAAIAVPERFSIAALLFGFLWALYRRLWLVAVVLAGVQLGVPYGVDLLGLDPALGSIAMLAFSIYVGCSANDWRREKLERSGYVLSGIAVGRDQAEAERRFFDSVHERRAAMIPPPSGPTPSRLPRAFGAA